MTICVAANGYILTFSQSHEIVALLWRQTCTYTINSLNTKRIDRKWQQSRHLKGRDAIVCVDFRQLIPFTTFSNPIVVPRPRLFVDFNDDGNKSVIEKEKDEIKRGRKMRIFQHGALCCVAEAVYHWGLWGNYVTEKTFFKNFKNSKNLLKILKL